MCKLQIAPPTGYQRRTMLEELAAYRTYDRAHANRNSNLTGTWDETIYANAVSYTAVASTASEATLLTGSNEQPTIPALFFMNPFSTRRALYIKAMGVFSTTGTPTLTFQARLSSTQGITTYSGASVGVSAAITSGSGVSNVWWGLELTLQCFTPGLGTNNLTLSGAGKVESPAGFASPFVYALEPTTPNTATWTSTIDGSLNQYLNLSLTWSASSSSNTCAMKSLLVKGYG